METTVENEQIKVLADFLFGILENRIRKVVDEIATEAAEQAIENRQDDIVDAVQRDLDIDAISDTVLEHFDYDEIVDRVNRELDISQLASDVKDELDLTQALQEILDKARIQVSVQR